jgi:hypothetical protein
MHAYCRRSLASLLKQRQTTSTDSQLPQQDRVRQPRESHTHGITVADHEAHQPPLVLPSLSASEVDESDDGDTIVYDVPKHTTVKRLRTTTVPAQPIRGHDHVQGPDHDIRNQQGYSQQATLIINAVSDPMPRCHVGIKHRSEAEVLQDCENLALRVTEWLYKDNEKETLTPREDPYDDQILDFLSPEHDKESSLSVSPIPKLTRTPPILVSYGHVTIMVMLTMLANATGAIPAHCPNDTK